MPASVFFLIFAQTIIPITKNTKIMKAKTKRIVMVIVSLLVCSAMQGQQKTQKTIELPSYESSLDVRHFKPAMLTNDRLEWATTRSGADLGYRWIDRISNMPDYLITYYNGYNDKVKEVLDGGVNWMSDPSLAVYDSKGNRFLVEIKTFQGSETFEYLDDVTPEQIGAYASEIAGNACDKNWEELNCFVNYLVLCLSMDFPEAFWLRSNYEWGGSNSASYEYGGGKCTVNYTQVTFFVVQSETYDCRMTGLQSPELISDAVVGFKSKVAEILSECPDGTDFEEIVYLNDWLTMHNRYNSALSPTIKLEDLPEIVFSPLSALHSLTGSEGPVCEGYSRAFKILCDQKDIPCVLMPGEAKGSKESAGEDHMWTEVMMSDGNWYAVDVTWNDPITPSTDLISGAENHNWLLLGRDDIVAPDWTFADSHPVSFLATLKEEYVSQWELSALSLITDHKYDPTDTDPSVGIDATSVTTDTPLQVYSLDGKFLGVFKSANEMREALNTRQVLIVNGKKTLSK